MNAHELQRRALAAVARLSIFAGMAGCGGNVVVDTDDPTDTNPGSGETDPAETTTYATTTETTTETASGTTTADPVASCSDAPMGSMEAIKCCNTLLLASYADDHLFTDPTLATAEEKACCELVVTTADDWMGPDPLPVDWSNVGACCNTLVSGGFQEHPSCTPWGPPMPPRMPARRTPRFAPQAVLA